MTTAADSKARILFVDDEPRILVALKALFRSSYEVCTANSGADAVALLKEKDFDVIVSDQRMPEMTGVEVLRSARELRPRAIRVLLTGDSDLSAILGAINDGEIFRFINKPWSNNDLRETIAAAVKASEVDQVPEAQALAKESEAAVAAPAVDADQTGILVLDEDSTTRDVLQRVLHKDRPVFTATDLDSALDVLEQQNIGVIITELAVGGESVTQLLAALREHHPALVAIVLTARADAGHGIELINRGQIYRFLSKPISEGLLRGSVNLAVRRFDILKKNPEQTRRLAAAKTPPKPETDRRGIFGRIGRLFGLTA